MDNALGASAGPETNEQHTAWQSLLRDNAHIDVLTHDLFAPASVAALHLPDGREAAALAHLKTLQRLGRITGGIGGEAAAGGQVALCALLDAGLDSAHKITALAQSQFVQLIGDRLGDGGRAQARTLYRRALNIRSQTMHLLAGVKALTAPHVSGMAVNHTGAALPAAFETLAGDQEIFAIDLNYCDCDECMSILGPAAYLVDLLRIIDKAVTQPNTRRANPADNIPANLRFFDRRPDLAALPLTCANTTDLVPYPDIVNDVLARSVAAALQADQQLPCDDVWLTLANCHFPAQLPFHRPLAQIRAILATVHAGAPAVPASLAGIYDALRGPGQPDWPARREYLGLSLEQAANLQPLTDPAARARRVSANFGITVSAGSLGGLDRLSTFMARSGLKRDDVMRLFERGLSAREAFDVSGVYHLSSRGSRLTLTQQGDRVSGTFDFAAGQAGHITATLSGRTLSGYWRTGAAAGSLAFQFRADGSGFTGRWSASYAGGWDALAWNGSRDAATPFTGGMIPHSLFINATLPARASLGVTVNADDPIGVFEQISFLSVDSLDALNGFTRLATLLGCSYMQLEWLLMSLSPPAADAQGNLTSTSKLDEKTLGEIAKIMLLQARHGLPLALLPTLWFELRTIGEGDGEGAQTPFDMVFNRLPVPGRPGGAAPYHPRCDSGGGGYPNPLYCDDVLSWQPGQVPAGTSATAADARRASLIVSAIPSSLDDVVRVAAAVLGAGKPVRLTVTNLSMLYRHCALARALALTSAEYLALARLCELVRDGRLQAALTRDDVLALCAAAAWIKPSGLSVFDIDYVCNGAGGAYAGAGYPVGGVAPLLRALAAALERVRLQPAAFAACAVPRGPAPLYAGLIDAGYLDPTGLLLRDPAALTLAALQAIAKGATPGQFEAVAAVLRGAGARQERCLSEQLAALFGAKPALTAALLNGVRARLNLPANLAIFTVRDVARADLADVLAGGKLDPAKVALIVAAAPAPTVLATPLYVTGKTATTWTLSDAAGVPLYLRQVDSATVAITIQLQSDDQASPPTAVLQFLTTLSQYLKLQQALALSIAQIVHVCAAPAAYGLAAPFRLTLDAVHQVVRLKRISAEFADTDNALLDYFAHVTPAGPQTWVASLAALTGWSSDQLALAWKQIGASAACATIDGLARLQRLFGIAAGLGMDAGTLTALGGLQSLPASADNWALYGAQAAALRQAARTACAPQAWPAVSARIDQPLQEQCRDALLGVASWTLQQRYQLKSPRDLYNFLLVDVEKGGCATVSYVKEALTAAQLYLRRCRLGLELNATISTDDIPEVWWEWLLNYRVWQADRQIFLYPENYIDPGLRMTRSSLLQDLENTLLQGEISAEVQAAYTKYLGDFCQLARLVYIDGVHCTVHDQLRGAFDSPEATHRPARRHGLRFACCA